jgi:c-di-GMP-binding flagellar brake protein YcgR
MSEESIETRSATQGQSREISDPAEIAGVLGQLAELRELLFFSESGTNRSFIANAVGVDAGRRTLRIALASGQGGTGIGVDNTFDVFVPIRNADLVFAVAGLHTVSGQENTYELAMPSTLRLWHRREHPRGSCFGLADIVLRPKDKPPSEALKARLHDISNAGIGISLPEGSEQNVRAGDAFDECVLLLNGKPMAVCAIEVLHTRRDADTGSLIAGGRFVHPNDVARERIAKLIATLDPLWGQPPHPSGD